MGVDRVVCVNVCSTDNTESDAKNYLTSYLAKTTMMWTCEGVDRSWWTQQNAGECLTVLLLILQSALETRTLRHYFVSTVNLLEGIPDTLAHRAKSARDILSLLNVISCLCNIDAFIAKFSVKYESTIKVSRGVTYSTVLSSPVLSYTVPVMSRPVHLVQYCSKIWCQPGRGRVRVI